MKNIRAFLSVVLAVSGACAFAAKDFYVSEDKSYGSDLVPPEQLFDDLQAAIDAADPEDTVLVDDGFVCKTGENAPVSTYDKVTGATNRIVITKAIMVRSKSGCVDEAQNKGATIVGAYSSAETKMGKDSIRPALVANGAVLVGFILEKGSAYANDQGGGGGVCVNGGTVSNCVVRNCYARYGGGVHCSSATAKVIDCVISNNVCSGSGGGIYQGTVDHCHIMNNSSITGGGVSYCTIRNSVVCGNQTGTTTSAYGGGAHSCTAFKTVFCCNTAPIREGGGVNGGVLVDCVVSNNVAGFYGGGCCKTVATNCLIIGNSTLGKTFPAGGGGAAGGTYYNCTNVANKAKAYGGGFFGYRAGVTTRAIKCTIRDNEDLSAYGGGGASGYNTDDMFLVDCLVSNNITAGSGGGVSKCYVTGGTICENTAKKSGGGAYSAIVTNCLIAANRTLDSGGGASGCTLVGCCVTNNIANKIGGGARDCTAHNCRFVSNVQTNTARGSGAGGAFDGHYYNCLFLGNKASASTGVGGIGANDVVSDFVNCTITGNEAGPDGGAGATCAKAGYMKLVNVICAGNTGTGTQWCSRDGDATDCCLENAKPEDGGTRIVREDPRLTPDENGNLVPKNRRCRNSGTVFSWMTDPNDVRSKDLAGRDRILGSAPDFGCFESTYYGLLLMVR